MATEIVAPRDVISFLGLNGTSPDDMNILDAVCSTVNVLIPTWVDNPTEPHIKQAAIMLAARFYRRRNSPGGVEVLGDVGPVYVSRNDPDLAMILGLGRFTRPKVG